MCEEGGVDGGEGEGIEVPDGARVEVGHTLCRGRTHSACHNAKSVNISSCWRPGKMRIVLKTDEIAMEIIDSETCYHAAVLPVSIPSHHDSYQHSDILEVEGTRRCRERQ